MLEITFPLPYLVSARGFIDKYGPDDTYDLVELIDRIEVPSLVVYGSVETASNVAFRGVGELLAARLRHEASRVATIAGADHVYSGCRKELLARLASWLARTLPAE